MADYVDNDLKAVLDWCVSVIGPCKVSSCDPRFHGRKTVLRLQTRSDCFYLKLHHERSWWEQEVHGCGQWAPAFGRFAPRLLAAREGDPFALIVSEVAGQSMSEVMLSREQEIQVWCQAGHALVDLHRLAPGTCFGSCRRDGICIEPISDPVVYMDRELEHRLEDGVKSGLFCERERAVVQKVRGLVSVFAGERPMPCHRDYGPANWLITPEGTWAGVIDFEFAHWDMRVTDFCRYPDWEWMLRPELVTAFFEGYGQPLNDREMQQCVVAHTRYALDAILWGHQAAFYGFEQEGRDALLHIEGLV